MVNSRRRSCIFDIFEAKTTDDDVDGFVRGDDDDGYAHIFVVES